MSAILQAELQAAAEAERRESRLTFRAVADAGRWSLTDEDAAAVLEEARERAAIQNEWQPEGAVVGLVSVPTTPTNAAYRAEQRCKALMVELGSGLTPETLDRSMHRVGGQRQFRDARKAALGATAVDKAKGRVARMRCKTGMAARAIQAAAAVRGFRPDYCAMLTLTYRKVDAWRPDHLTRFVDRLRLWMKRAGMAMRYVWVAEVQTREAIHYHFALWLPHGRKIPKVDLPRGEAHDGPDGPYMLLSQRPFWTHGSSRIEAARDAVGYLMSYLQKDKFRDAALLPGGARMHGAGGLEHVYRRARRWVTLPGWVRARADIHDDWRRATGGGWSDPDGFVIPSEHQRAWVGDRWACIKVADYGRPFEAAGPFTWLRNREIP